MAPDAARLMRSRYSAYVLGLDDYLLATWHPATRPASAVYLPDGLRWLGLELRRHVQVDESHAIVEFVARSKLAGKANRHHEVSRFERSQGHWLYLDDKG